MQCVFGALRPSCGLRSVGVACNTWRGMSSEKTMNLGDVSKEFQFGPLRIPNSQAFAVTQLSYAFVNLKPLVPGSPLHNPDPQCWQRCASGRDRVKGVDKSGRNIGYANVMFGHVLISPQRVVPRVADLTTVEIADMWQLAQDVGACMEAEFKADGLTLAIQDGPAAGQTVPHVHIHCVPRNFKDLEQNDQIYERIDEAEAHESAARQRQALGDVDIERKPRSGEEMAEEAARFRELMILTTRAPE